MTAAIEPLVLDGPRARLAPVGPDDAAFVQQLERAPDVVLRYRLRGATAAPTTDDATARFVVIDRGESRRAGVAVLYGLDLAAGHARAAAAVTEQYRNAPWLGGAYLLFTRFAFRAFPIDALYGEVPGYNDLEVRGGLGRVFAEEGRLRDHLWADGRWWDLIYYRITRDELAALDAARPRGSALTARLRAREAITVQPGPGGAEEPATGESAGSGGR